MIKHNFNRYKNAFSLAEILLSVTIVAIILLLAMPAITKKSLDNVKQARTTADSAEFYYTETKNPENLPCYVTTSYTNAADGNIVTVVKDSTGECQSYDFTIPKNVRKVDLTLVAGGGGGGGAGGAKLATTTLTPTTAETRFNKTRFKNATIKILTGAGTEGNSDTTRKGGNSGTTVVDFKIPRSFVVGNENLNIFKTDVSSLATAEEIVYATLQIPLNGEGLVDTAQTPVPVDFKGLGIRFRGKMQDSVSDYNAIFFLSDAISGSNPENASKVLCGSNVTNAAAAGPSVDLTSTAQIASFTGQYIPNGSDITTKLCKLNPASYKASVEGELPVAPPEEGMTITTGKISVGGKGGNNGTAYFERGKGGNGASLVYNCYKEDGTNSKTTCTWKAGATDISTDKLTADTEAGARYGELTLEIEHPGGGGSGGVGGSAVKITNFEVSPGKTYKMVVGKGGSGGTKGTSGTTVTSGAQGTGGSSSAIYDENGKLIVMVIGGVGGTGGRVVNQNSVSNSSSPGAPIASRNTPLVIIGSDYISKIQPSSNFDSSFGTAQALDSSIDLTDIDSTGAMSGATAVRIVYSFMKNMTPPLFALSTSNIYYITNPTQYHFTRYNTDDRRMGGFSSYFATALTSTGNQYRVFLNGNFRYKGKDVQYPYTGFYFRYPVLNSYYYAGGLGGFSGLGGKAGCGGAFVGNYDGWRIVTDALSNRITLNDSLLGNTIGFLKTEGGTNKAKIFDVGDFYDGCTTAVTDGHEARFVHPVISNGKIENYGSAGAGGGGGGYNINLGSGNGGNGQNGYIVITWKK